MTTNIQIGDRVRLTEVAISRYRQSLQKAPDIISTIQVVFGEDFKGTGTIRNIIYGCSQVEVQNTKLRSKPRVVLFTSSVYIVSSFDFPEELFQI